MKESFNTNTDALSHDSDPRKLNFLQISQQPDVMFQQGETVLRNFGPDVNLAYAKAFGAVETPPATATTAGDFAGGAGNKVTLTMQPPVTFPAIADLTDGSQSFTIYDGSDNVLISFGMTRALLQSLCAAQGLSGVKSGTVRVTGLDLSSLIGQSIAKIVIANTVAWAPPKKTTSLFSWYLHHTTNNVELAQISLEDPPHSSTVSGTSFVIAPGDEIWLQFSLESEPITVDIPIAGSDIVAWATAEGLATASNGVIAHFGGTVLNGYAGYTFLESKITIANPWTSTGVALDSAAQLPDISLVDAVTTQSWKLGAVSSMIAPISFSEVANGQFIIANNLRLAVRFTLPAGHDSLLYPLLVTEAYEIRQRNRAAFTFACKPPFTERPGDYSSPTYKVLCFGSQGPVDGRQRWTQCDFNVLPDNDNYTEKVLDTYPLYFEFLPDDWNTQLTFVPVCQAPFNYVRFVILPNTGDLTGSILSVIANAREL